MSIHFQINVDGDDADHAIAEFRKVFGAMVGATPAVAVGAVTAGDTGQAFTGVATGGVQTPVNGCEQLVLDPAPKKTRKTKDKAPEVIDNVPLADATSAAEKVDATTSTSSTAENSEASASTASSVPDLDLVREKLKNFFTSTLAAAVAGGANKKDAEEHASVVMFNFLAKFGATKASTIPEDKRAAVIAALDAGPSDVVAPPTVQDVQAKLKAIGAVDGLGHDKVFELLAKYGAKSSATVPEDRRAELIAEIDELLAGAQ